MDLRTTTELSALRLTIDYDKYDKEQRANLMRAQAAGLMVADWLHRHNEHLQAFKEGGLHFEDVLEAAILENEARRK